MPNISWNEIGHRALLFSREWQHATSEQADKQTFWNDFFNIFGISRRVVSSFEEPVKRISGTTGFIDLFWPGKLLVEHKSAGHSLDTAESQAFDYIHDLISSGRQEEAPRYVLLSDFRHFALYDLEPDRHENLPLFHGLRYDRIEFPLSELRRNIAAFAFIPGYSTRRPIEQDPINLKAVTIMTRLHDTLKAGGYKGHQLERFLVRILFCLFAEDTGIFEPSAFQLYIEDRTAADGSDLGIRLGLLFEVLDTDTPDRQQNLDETLAAFPYVNGQLFSERLNFAAFNTDMRIALLACTRFDWSRISPAIFGALFQEVMTDKERRKIGAHYTSERDILKLIQPLFMDGLHAELEAAKADRSNRRRARLDALREKLTTLKFFDPACGCGNFLVIAYRELRLLELDLLKEINQGQQNMTLDEVNKLSRTTVDQFYGIEIEEWPARIAEVALWLMDHQMNMRIHETFGQHYLRLPLRNTPHIRHENALRIEWSDVISPHDCSYILGNPPFVGHQWRDREQVIDMNHIWGEGGRFGRLDYVTCWYKLAAQYMKTNHHIRAAFVSTNSITQGEQVGILWASLFGDSVQINFAHRTFSWTSEARGKAAVHCVIIGFALEAESEKRLFSYSNLDAPPVSTSAKNINPYLVDAPNVILPSRTDPPTHVPPIFKGSQPTDGGHLILTEKEHKNLIEQEPGARPFTRPFIGGEELITGKGRWCLWLKNITPATLQKLPMVRARVQLVRESRLKSPTKSVREFAAKPSLFTQDRQPSTRYLAIPEVSSETRIYIPIAFLSANTIASNKLQIIAGGTLYQFGILTSVIHMAWVKAVCGRLESRLSYAPSVYNNYPWPEDTTPAQRTRIEELAQAILDARARYPDSTLAELYDPLLMPPDLLKAHQTLDRAVDRLYRPDRFSNDQARVEYLFALYERLTTLFPTARPARRRFPPQQ
ncbi:MAG: DNA methyltransferase [Acidobacteriaceae bacterium]